MAVIGGGICGVSVAAFLAEGGLRVGLFERSSIAAAASGRNSGVIQNPFDAHLAALHRESLDIYRALAMEDHELNLPEQPAGVLLVSQHHESVAAAARSIARQAPELEPELVDATALHALEPGLAPGLAGCRLSTGYPVAPATATRAMADRARRAGAAVATGVDVHSLVADGGRVAGLRMANGQAIACEQVVVAAGPWTPALVPGWAETPPISSVWGVVVSAKLAQAPGHVLEELGIDRPGGPPEELFSLVTAGGDSSVGSTFLVDMPDPAERAPQLMRRAAEFVPELAAAPQSAVRVCARPVSVDGRPFIGALKNVRGLFVCAGHGPWGISTGPGSARRVAELILGRTSEDPVFSPSRLATR